MFRFKPHFQRSTRLVRAGWRRWWPWMLGIALVVLLGSVTIASATRQPAETPAPSPVPIKKVEVMKVGDAVLSERASGTVKNLTSLQLVAQTAGPVSQILVSEGQMVKKGQVLVRQSSAYEAGSSASVQRQVAAKGYELAKATAENTSSVVAKNRELADLNRDNTEELRKINDQSLGEIRSLLTTTEQVISKIESDIRTEEQGANNPATIQSLRQSLISYKAVLNQNRSALRSAEYSTNTDKPPTKISNLTRDLVFQTTEIQLKSAQLNQEIAGLNLQLARIAEAATRVAAPISARVEKVFVQVGQYVTPGTPVIKIKGDPKLYLQIPVAADVAARIDATRALEVMVNDQPLSLPISHVSQSPVSGQLYEVLATIPTSFASTFQEETLVEVTLPFVTNSSRATFLPMTSVFLTNTQTFVYVLKDGVAQLREVELGEVVGTNVEIKNGVHPGELIILDRTVLEGQAVEAVYDSASVEERG
jgi:RND family efflux transporter MFP subunit